MTKLIQTEKEQDFIKIINNYESMIESLHDENKRLTDITKAKTRIIAKKNLTIRFLQEMK
ncbi:TPA: hypothetical protein JLO99_002723 [Escherichia coli]|nr:hypothetical protein [Escherichia coli]